MFIIWSLLIFVAHATLQPCFNDFALVNHEVWSLTKDGRNFKVLALGNAGAELPPDAVVAIREATEIVYELAPETAPRTGTARFPTRAERPLDELMEPRLFARLVKRLAVSGVPEWAVAHLDPALALALLDANPVRAPGRSALDAVRGLADEKMTAGFETADEQERLVAEAVTVEDLTKILNVDLSLPDHRALKGLLRDVYRKLAHERYQGWVSVIGDEVRRFSRSLFVVNVVHIRGPGNLLDQLRQRGYRLERLTKQLEY